MTERFSMPGLKPGVWTVDVAQDEDLEAALGRAGRLGANVQGIAYTTAGARALQSVSGQSLCDTGDNKVPLDTVYELRLWAVTRRDGEDDGVLARELRWLNGSGSAEVAVLRADGVGDGAATGAEDCWYRTNAYLQHSDSERDPRKMPAMESIEVFIIEDEYGNTVFVDELMTGEWKRNG
mgnify:CR=1 FL=1